MHREFVFYSRTLWEALCCFIISQNNNIPRIKGIVSRLCEHFGEKIPGGFAFPAPEVLANCTVEDLAPLRSGFRAKYILNAAQKVAQGIIILDAMKTMPLEEVRQQLMTIQRGRSKSSGMCSFIWITSLGSVSYGCVDETSNGDSVPQ